MENLNRTVSAHNNKYNHNSSIPSRTNNSLFLSRTGSFLSRINSSSFPNSSKEITLIVLSKIRLEHSRRFSTKIDTDFQFKPLNSSNNNNSFLETNSLLLRDNNSSSNQDSFKIQEVFKPISNC